MAPTETREGFRHRIGNLLIPLILLVIAAIYFVESLGYPEQEDVGPAAVPHLWILFTSVFCVYLIVRSARGRGKPDPVPGRIGFVAAFAVALMAYLAAIETIGYFVSTFVFLIGSMYAMTYRNFVVMGCVAVGWLVFSYFVFVKLLYIPLPIGPLLSPILE